MSIAELKELYDRYKVDPNFDHLREDDINFVPGTGILSPTAMIVGEAPGVDENARCIPFVGKAGTELQKLLKRVDIDIGYLYFTNTVKYWPRNEERKSRPPTEEEIEASRKYLKREIEIVDPSFIALCGKTATRAIFPNIVVLQEVLGKLIDKKYLPLYHPAFVIYKREKYKEVLSGYEILANLIKTLD